MKFCNLLSFALTLAVSSQQVASMCSNSGPLTQAGTLWSGSCLMTDVVPSVARNGKYPLIFGWGTESLSGTSARYPMLMYMGMPVLIFPIPQVRSVDVDQTTGIMHLKNDKGESVANYGKTLAACNVGTTKTPSLTLDFDGTFYVTNGCNKNYFYNLKAGPKFFAYNRIFNQSPSVDNVVDTRGSNAMIYLLDSGFSPSRWDPYGYLPVGAVRTLTTTSITKTDDENGHGTILAMLLRSQVFGFARGAALTSIRITPVGSGKTFSLKSVMEAMRAVDSDFSGKTKIVNLSGWFNTLNFPGSGDTASRTLNCAFELAAKKGVSIFMAAGNQNVMRSGKSNWAFVLGSYKSSTGDAVVTKSNYGDSVNLFAPGDYVSNEFTGTSVSSALGAAVAAAMLDDASIRGNVKAYAGSTEKWQVPSHLYQAIFLARDESVLLSSTKTGYRANNWSLRSQVPAFTDTNRFYSEFSATAQDCSVLGVSKYDDLVDRANSIADVGSLVNDFTGPESRSFCLDTDSGYAMTCAA